MVCVGTGGGAVEDEGALCLSWVGVQNPQRGQAQGPLIPTTLPPVPTPEREACASL